jgi:glycosyltransferase involved in cell wall biosynthesis
MNILLEAHRLVRTKDFGGIDSYWRCLIPELLAERSEQDRLALFSAFLNPKHALALLPYRKQGALLRHWWASPNWLHALGRFGLRFEQLAGPADVVHLPEPVAPLPTNKPLVVTAHDLMYLHAPQYLDPRWTARLMEGTTALASKATLWIAVSEHTREDLIQHFGVPRGRTVVIPHGLDERFRQAATKAPALSAELQSKLPQGKGFFLFVGSVEPKKNLPTLLRAFAHSLEQEGQSSDLVVAGRAGWQLEEIQEVLERHPVLKDRVHFTGFIAHEDLPSLVAQARALVLPSRYEGFGMPVLEAMAAGTPVLCSNRAALPEVAGGAAVLFEADDVDGLSELLQHIDADDTACENLRRLGIERSSQFSWPRCARETLAAYHQAAELPK